MVILRVSQLVLCRALHSAFKESGLRHWKQQVGRDQVMACGG